MTARPFVAEAEDGFSPSWRTIRHLQRLAKKKGLIANWPVIAVLANHDLLLDCSHVTGEYGADLIAKKRNGKWKFEVEP